MIRGRKEFAWALIFGAATFSLVSGAWAAEDARVLPQGRSRFSVIYGQSAGVDQTFDGQGRRESITQPYNVSLTSEVLKKVKIQTKDGSPAELIEMLNYNKNERFDLSKVNTASHGIVSASESPDAPLVGDALKIGEIHPQAEAERQQYNISYQYGITDHLSAGFLIPYIHQRVRVSPGLSGNNTAEAIYKAKAQQNAGCQSDSACSTARQIENGLNALRSVNEDTLQQVLAAQDYDRFQDLDESGMGDVIFGGRFNYLNTYTRRNGGFISSVQLGATVPTGKLRNERDLASSDFGQGAWDTGVANILNYSPHWRWTFTHSIHYTMPFAATRSLRVRDNPDDIIPNASTEENVQFNLGDKYWTALGARFALSEGWSVDCGYEWYWKRPDRFQGSRGKDYTYLSNLTDKYTETAQLGISYNGIASFLKGDFPAPLEISFNYYWLRAGRNAYVAPYGTAELALYF
jgi:hypothetical protein